MVSPYQKNKISKKRVAVMGDTFTICNNLLKEIKKIIVEEKITDRKIYTAKNISEIMCGTYLLVWGVDCQCDDIHERLNKIIKLYPNLKKVIVYNDSCLVDWITIPSAGIIGYLTINQVESHLKDALLSIRKHGIYLPKEYHSEFIKKHLNKFELNPPVYKMILDWEAARSILSVRECEVYELVIQGKTAKEISETIYLSVSTVNDYVNSLFKKLGVNNRVLAITKGIKMGLIK